MTSHWMARSGPVPALMPGTIDLGRGERETRGEHRGRGERLSSDSRFVFVVPVFLILLLLSAPAAANAQTTAGDITVGMRVGGVIGTRLVADDIGGSIIPSPDIADNFRRDTIKVTMAVSPDVELVGQYALDEETAVHVAVGYSFGSLRVTQGDESRDAGSLALGRAIVAVQKPVKGYLARAGAGVLWFHDSDLGVIREMRTLNPVLELGVARRWPWSGLDVDVGLAAQAAHLSSAAIEARGGQPGLAYRLALQVGVWRGLGR